MTLDEFHIMQMSDIHDAALIERGLHPEYASISYLEKYAATVEAKGITEGVEQVEKEIKKSVAEEMKLVLSDYIFAAFIHKLVSNPDELFIYKKQFTCYLAAQSFFSYAFRAAHQDLSTLMFCKRTGKVYYSNYIMNNMGSEGAAPLVPFRLTPNLQFFMTPIGIEGPFAGAITAAALCLQRKKRLYFCGYLALFYRDLLDDCRDLNVAKAISENFDRTLSNISGLVDFEIVEKLFKSRHAVFKTEKMPGGEEKREELGEKSYWACFNQKTGSLIKEAQDPALLNEMPLAWAPWF